MKSYKLFEYGKIEGFDRSLLEPYVKQVWKERFASQENIVEDKEYQGILEFDGNEAKAKNYIGFIQTEKEQIEIYPKVFRRFSLQGSNTYLFHKHLFFWFDYCRKWKFPFTKVNLDKFNQLELPELIISLMADRIFEVVSRSPISLYEEVEESLQMPRGRINISRYVNQRLVRGDQHIIECDVEPLQYDNRLNRAIKYVSRILSNKARFIETRRKLDDILFLLDEVEDTPCTSRHLDTIRINSYYSDYLELVDICRLVLDQQLYNNQYYEQTQWSLLFPMEYIFEDFIAGYLEKHFSREWKVEYQKSEKYLTDERVFQMQHDIFLTNKADPKLKLIVDTKYKIRSAASKQDKKKGVSQSDLYQMTSYAFRRGCNTVLLLYPNDSEQIQSNDYFTISSGFNGKDKVKVIAAEVSFWNMSNFQSLSTNLQQGLVAILDQAKELSL
jgi:5-methylcytosine-specific restriction enzyme subunit McrC